MSPHIYAMTLIIGLCCQTLVAAAPVVQPPYDDQPTAQMLLDKNAECAAKLTALSYKFAKTVTCPAEPEFNAKTQGDVIDRRPFRFVHTIRTTATAREETRATINGEYFAFWNVPNSIAYVMRHDGIANQSKEGRDTASISLGDDLLLNGTFGIGGRALADSVKDTGRHQWLLDNSGDADKTHFHLRNYRTDGGKRGEIAFDIVLSSKQDFQVIQWTMYDHGAPLENVSVNSKQIGPGHQWAPASIRDVRFSEKVRNVPVVDTLIETELSDVQIAPRIDDTQFQISALKLPEGLTVVDTGIDGKSRSAKWVNGGLVANIATK